MVRRELQASTPCLAAVRTQDQEVNGDGGGRVGGHDSREGSCDVKRNICQGQLDGVAAHLADGVGAVDRGLGACRIDRHIQGYGPSGGDGDTL
jgi:hypothetical protein